MNELTLEERLNRLSEGARQEFISELIRNKILPSDVIKGRVVLIDDAAQKLLYRRDNRKYMKDDLAPYIADRLQRDGVPLDSGQDSLQEALYHSLTKEPMKRAFWGQINAYPPRDIMQELPPWIAFYFYAGIWTKKTTLFDHKKFFPNNLKNAPIYMIVRDCVLEGIDTIKKVHNKKYQEGDYKNPMQHAPHESEIKERLAKPISINSAQYQLNFG